MKKILVIGATGAMGVYLTESLLRMGYSVDGVTMLDTIPHHKNLRYLRINGKDLGTMISLVTENSYSAIIDFMTYGSCDEFRPFMDLYTENADHYVFLSSYRVYAGSHPLIEASPRLLDVSDDDELLSSSDYSIYKAREEDMLRMSGHQNYTILRPAITYSKVRFQLVTMEANMFIPRMLEGRAVVLPEPALDRFATMSWGGDVGEMIARLVLNKDAMQETFIVSSAESHTWREIAKIYEKIGGLKYVPVSTDEYLSIFGSDNPAFRRQLVLDRYFDRIIDNSKILRVTGMTEGELMPLESGLRREITALRKDTIRPNVETDERINALLKCK